MTDTPSPPQHSSALSTAGDLGILFLFVAVAFGVFVAMVWAVFALLNDQYSSLERVGFPVAQEELQGFLPGEFWLYDPGEEPPPPETQLDIEGVVFPAVHLPEEATAAIAAAREQRKLWTFNGNDYICLALYLMNDTEQAVQVAEEIDRAAAQWGRSQMLRATNRTNILIVFVFSGRNYTQPSQDAFAEFLRRGPELIR